MRAWQVNKHGEPEEVLKLVEKEVPEPGPGEIRIRVAAVALALPDVFMCHGSYPFQPSLPFTPGQEVVGVVTAVGSQVQDAGLGCPFSYRAFGRGFAQQRLGIVKLCDGLGFPLGKEQRGQIRVAGGRVADDERRLSRKL